uniref:Large ribosomal subunit protein bL21m n=1 Tax=Photinus pyralis TaxID=7054 RepID=A0A1Y1MJX5_PHOPY
MSWLRQLCLNFTKYTRISTTGALNITNLRIGHAFSTAPTPYEVVNPNEHKQLTDEIIGRVNEEKKGRLFAIVHLAGKQFKVTEGDVIVVEGYWPPTTGDKINLDKVLMLGAPNFTLIGRPLIQTSLIDVHATVIEKTLSHTKVNFKKKRRKQYKRINFYRIQQTMLRINKVGFVGELNKPEGVVVKDRSYT